MATPRPAVVDNDDVGLAKELEVLIAPSWAVQTFYTPSDDGERALDKKVNRKLDRIVLATLAIQFTVRSLSQAVRRLT